MATLSAQINTDVQVVVASAHLIDLTNQRDSDSSIDSTVLSKACDLAAAKVQSYLGAVDGDDTEAVDIGVRLVLVQLKQSFSLVGPVQDTRQQLIAELAELRDMRVMEVDLQVGNRDWTNLDSVYPNTKWDQGEVEDTKDSL